MRLIVSWSSIPEPSLRVFLAPATVVIGRDPQCEVVLNDQRVSRQHAKIVLDDSGAQLIDLSAYGTLVNGKKCSKAALADGDHIAIGKVELEVRLVPGSTEREVASLPAAIPLNTLAGETVEIAGYTLGRCLGQGAYGAVFEATDAKGTTVAIKVMKLRSELTDEDRGRFFREASTASTLVHRHVVRVVDQGQAGPVFYIAMEFVAGETARELIAREGPLPIRKALKIARAVASALEAARLAHLVHRDVKPENVLLGTDGSIKLADFGFAKSVLTAGQSGLTREGDVLGTLAYMAPEQLVSAIYADHRSDIYSLGAMLYHLMAGETAFSASTQVDYFNKILREPPRPIAELRDDVPPLVRILLDKCLRKKADERYRTAGEIVRLLDLVVGKSSGSHPALTPERA